MFDQAIVTSSGPAQIVAGVGCRRGAPASEIIALIESALFEAGLSEDDLSVIATHAIKCNEPGILEAAEHFAVPVRGFDKSALDRYDLPTPSLAVQHLFGVAGIAEAAAMALGTLVLNKRKSTSATCALARVDGVALTPESAETQVSV